MTASFFFGFKTGLSLILAIGAQNAFVLQHGLWRLHLFWICFICALSDAILIAFGVSGFGALVLSAPWIDPVMRWLGALFLTYYGFMNLRAAWLGGVSLEANAEKASLTRTILVCLALTWLNPHVYLDTVVLLGSVATQAESKMYFALGAVTSSFVFFFSLGYGARFLAPIFKREMSWQILNFLIAILMFSIAIGLVTLNHS